MNTAQPNTIALASIRRDPKLSCRALGINERTVAEYAESMRAGAVFPPVVVFRDRWNTHWLADGFHRTAAAELAGLAEIGADIREGGQKDAILHAASANSVHGLRRTNADKRRAVELVLTSHPKWPDRQIGEACGVDHKTVAAVKRRLAGGELPHAEAHAGVKQGGSAKSGALNGPLTDAELLALLAEIAAPSARITAVVSQLQAGFAKLYPSGFGGEAALAWSLRAKQSPALHALDGALGAAALLERLLIHGKATESASTSGAQAEKVPVAAGARRKGKKGGTVSTTRTEAT